MDFQELLNQSPILALVVSCICAIITVIFNRFDLSAIKKAVNPQKLISKNSQRAERFIVDDFEKMRKFHNKQVALIDKKLNLEVDARSTFRLGILKEYHLNALKNLDVNIGISIDLEEKKQNLTDNEKGGDENGNDDC